MEQNASLTARVAELEQSNVPEEVEYLECRVEQMEQMAPSAAAAEEVTTSLVGATTPEATDTVPLHGTMNHSPNKLSKIAFQIKLRVFLNTGEIEN